MVRPIADFHKNLDPTTRQYALLIEQFYDQGYDWEKAMHLARQEIWPGWFSIVDSLDEPQQPKEEIKITTEPTAVKNAKAANDQLVCNFCGKKKLDVDRLIAGPGVHICNECIALCNEILEEDHPGVARRVQAEIVWAHDHKSTCVSISALRWALGNRQGE